MPTIAAVDQVRRRAQSLARHHGPDRSGRAPRHMSIVVVDVTGFGRLDNLSQLQVRRSLNLAVRRAFRRAGIRWSLSIEDRGDGMIILVPAQKSTVEVLDPVLPVLAAQIRRHNESAHLRIRLRISVHVGVVHRDATGWVGSDLTTACRLVDSPVVRLHLHRRPEADLVVAVSEQVYQGVVAHRYRRLDPAAYEPVHVSVKELSTRAWVQVPEADTGHGHGSRS